MKSMRITQQLAPVVVQWQYRMKTPLQQEHTPLSNNLKLKNCVSALGNRNTESNEVKLLNTVF